MRNNDGLGNINKESNAAKVHKELFKNSISNDYYHFGMAQAFSGLCFVLDSLKDHTFTGQDILDIVKNTVEQNKDIKYYFDKLNEK